ncbi:hypothetical protein BO99DRAFT_344216 [Aspergillus violaceofuscus CBS 115571]|uniref:F-box domain-containing protein n=1 Tax=Aspergillus violaceofuscus (strain CBS 115571) TaxID=1450538 RepID=A0A2V5HFL9_ASPV1|nr:hypothetical protein BO99DRAFT_344216 [Aspergillus violaceofuscus CBS 115571]
MTATPQRELSIETLPAKLRFKILLLLSYQDLTALTMASPVFSRQLRAEGHDVLWNLVTVSLRGLLPEAEAVYCSGQLKSAKARTKERIAEMVEEYRVSRLLTEEPPPKTTSFTLDDLLYILRYHHKVIVPMYQRFTTWVLENLAKEIGQPSASVQRKISSTEESRIIRALYRFQLCCHLFGNRSVDRPWRDSRLGTASTDILQHLETMFYAWEIEEILCIYAFAEDQYNGIFNAVREDLDPMNFEMDSEFLMRETYREGTVSQGLSLLLRALCEMEKDHAQLLATMQARLCCDNTEFIGPNEILSSCALEGRAMSDELTDRDLKSQAREAFPFRGDHVPDPKGEFPPRAWTLIWHDTYSNIMGCWIPSALRDWGYVFWDAGQFETEAKEVLVRQWKSLYWGEEMDPRNDLYGYGEE